MSPGVVETNGEDDSDEEVDWNWKARRNGVGANTVEEGIGAGAGKEEKWDEAEEKPKTEVDGPTGGATGGCVVPDVEKRGWKAGAVADKVDSLKALSVGVLQDGVGAASLGDGFEREIDVTRAFAGRAWPSMISTWDQPARLLSTRRREKA